MTWNASIFPFGVLLAPLVVGRLFFNPHSGGKWLLGPLLSPYVANQTWFVTLLAFLHSEKLTLIYIAVLWLGQTIWRINL
jgi:hypothetical protein